MFKNLLTTLLILTSVIPPGAMASKIQQQGIVTHTDCSNRGVSDANCIPLSSQVYDTTNGQLLSVSISNGALGGSGGSGVQLLVNPSFEIGSSFPLTGWTVASGTGTVDTTNFYAGKQAATITASSQQSTLTQDVTLTQTYASVNMEASCKVKTSLTNVQVCARLGGSNLSSCSPVPSTNTWQYVPMNFVGPSSGTIGVQAGMTSSGTGAFDVDDCYVGPARNLSQVSQAQLLGTINYAAASTCVWITASSSFTSFSAQSTCATPTVTGSASAPATKVPEIDFASLAPGDYYLVARGSFWNTTSGSGQQSNLWRMFEATTSSASSDQALMAQLGGGNIATPVINGHITLTAPVTNAKFQIQAEVPSTSTSGTSAQIGDQLSSVDSALSLEIDVYYFPSQSQAAVNSNSIGSSGIIVSGGNGYGSTNTGVRKYSSIQRQSGSDITYTTSSTLGDSFTINTPGNYSMWGSDLAASGTPEPYVSLNAATFTVGNFNQIGSLAICTTGTNAQCAFGASYYLNAGDVIRVQESASATGTGGALATFGITKVMPSQPVPILVGSVTSSGAAAYHNEALSGVCSSSASIGGSTLGTAPTTGNISSGCCTVTFPAGEFSATPFIVSGLSASSSLSTVVESSCSSSTSCTVCDSVGGTTTFNYQSMLMGTH